MDLFYSSLIIFKDTLNGTIFNNGWLKIMKEVTPQEKETWFNNFKIENQISDELWSKINNIELNSCKTYADILSAIEKNLHNYIYPMVETTSFNLLDWLKSHPYLVIGTILTTVIIAYLNKEKIYSYVEWLGESILEIINTQRELTKITHIAMEHDKIMATVIQNLQDNVVYNSAVNQTIVEEYGNMLTYIKTLLDQVNTLTHDHEQLSTDLQEASTIIQKMLQIGPGI
jgi:hypothetical protein